MIRVKWRLRTKLNKCLISYYLQQLCKTLHGQHKDASTLKRKCVLHTLAC